MSGNLSEIFIGHSNIIYQEDPIPRRRIWTIDGKDQQNIWSDQVPGDGQGPNNKYWSPVIYLLH